MSSNELEKTQENKSIMNTGEKSIFVRLQKTGLKFDKDLTDGERLQLAMISDKYGLDPFMEHVTVLYSRMYVTNKGLTFLMNKSGRRLPLQKLEDIKFEYNDAKNEVIATIRMYIAPEGYTASMWLHYCIHEIGLTYEQALNTMIVEGRGKSNPQRNKMKDLQVTYREELALKDARNQLLRNVLAIGLPVDDDVDFINSMNNESTPKQMKNITGASIVKKEEPVTKPELKQIDPVQDELRTFLESKELSTQAEMEIHIANGSFNEWASRLKEDFMSKQMDEIENQEQLIMRDPIKFIMESEKLTLDQYHKALWYWFNNKKVPQYFDQFLESLVKDAGKTKATQKIYNDIVEMINVNPDSMLKMARSIYESTQKDSEQKETERQHLNKDIKGPGTIRE